jgi:hypothetical protein
VRTAERGAVAVTAVDGREHLVPEYALAERWRADGWYPTWCGTQVVGAAMSQPPGRPCELCNCVATSCSVGVPRSLASPAPQADALPSGWWAGVKTALIARTRVRTSKRFTKTSRKSRLA